MAPLSVSCKKQFVYKWSRLTGKNVWLTGYKMVFEIILQWLIYLSINLVVGTVIN